MRVLLAMLAIPLLMGAGGELRHDLQGMRFSGPLAAQGQQDAPIDLLSFEGGRFTSRVCGEYGFIPVPYWVRRDEDGLHFRAVLRHPEHGTIRFEGVFDGEALDATAHWTKERWYWTVEQQFYFDGAPVANSP